MNQTVYVGLSGGVDSAVAAVLLKQKGYDVRGIFLREYDLSLSASLRDALECTQEADRQSAVVVAGALDIPFEIWDFRTAYHRHVVEYVFDQYAKGRTPNPDVMCNKHLKFGLFLKEALRRGGSFVATGHYIRLRRKIPNNKFQMTNRFEYQLLRGKDVNKDQSYFLYTLTQQQLAHCLFPLGNLIKPEVRALAKKHKLPNWNRKDSQGICFVGKIAMKDFLKTRIPTKKGKLITTAGEVVGEHDGAAYFTIGQRHGTGYGGGGKPLYVVATDVKKNLVIVGTEKDERLFRTELICKDVHWILGSPPTSPCKARARIRYRQPLQDCLITRAGGKKLHVSFSRPQRAVTPGQAVVFYSRGVMLGGGSIA